MDALLNNLADEHSNPVLLVVAGLAMLAASLPCVLAMTHDLIVGADNLVGALMAGGFAAVVAVAGLFLMVFAFLRYREQARTKERQRETVVLSQAQAYGGRLTVAELALDERLSIAESTEVLERLERLGLATSAVSEEGQVVYVFPAFDNPRDKLDTDIISFDRALRETEVQALSHRTLPEEIAEAYRTATSPVDNDTTVADAVTAVHARSRANIPGGDP
ncbi:MAG: hypothetical protein AAFS10_08130 [Myxococcota bacterium]